MRKWSMSAASNFKLMPTSPDKAMKVSDTDDEYRFVEEFTCECGKSKTLKITGSAYLIYDKRPVVMLKATCCNCGAIYEFFFDRSEVRDPESGLTIGEAVARLSDILRQFDAKEREVGEDEF